MLKGQYQHNIDSKGRLAIPQKIREELGGQFVICQGLDNCLFVYSQESWENIETRLSEFPMSARDAQRFVMSSAMEAEVDVQGRVVIPSHLREYAGLEKEITVLGVGARAEIWDKKRCEAILSKNTPDDIAELMDKLGF